MSKTHVFLRVAMLVVVLAGAVTPTAIAQGPDAPARQYNGSFIAAGLIGGASILQDGRFDHPLGWTAGAYGRVASVLSLVDLQLEYHVAQHDLVAGPSAPADLTLERHSVVTSMNLHPLFLQVLGNNWLAYSLSALYVQVGFSTEFARYRTDAADWRRSDIAFSLHIGAGVDLPLGDANGPGAFWIGAMWRWKFVYMDPELDRSGEAPNELNAHAVVLTVSYRYNNISFGEAPAR